MYSIGQLSMISGLSTRTLRNYIKSGILNGSKAGGVWVFSEEEISAFISDPAVRPSIEAKRNAIIYDFQSGFDCTENESCLMLNLSLGAADARRAAEFFCAQAGYSEHIRFSYSYEKGKARFILKGTEAEIKAIMEEYYKR